jgi:hypothetical protein
VTLNLGSLLDFLSTAAVTTGDLPDLSTLPVQATHYQARHYLGLLIALQRRKNQNQKGMGGGTTITTITGEHGQAGTILKDLLQSCAEYIYMLCTAGKGDDSGHEDAARILTNIDSIAQQAMALVKASRPKPAVQSDSRRVLGSGGSATITTSGSQHGAAASIGAQTAPAAAAAPGMAAGLPAGPGWGTVSTGGLQAHDSDLPAAWMAACTPPAGHTDPHFQQVYSHTTSSHEEQAGQEEEDFLALLLG